MAVRQHTQPNRFKASSVDDGTGPMLCLSKNTTKEWSLGISGHNNRKSLLRGLRERPFHPAPVFFFLPCLMPPNRKKDKKALSHRLVSLYSLFFVF
jgi:hypothetical protein